MFRLDMAHAGELINLKENPKMCLGLYAVKIVTHGGLVITRMLCNGHAQPSDATSRWRESQEWFVAMTFNSFMMLFPVLFVPTDGLGNPWRLVTRSSYKKCKVVKAFQPPLGRQPSRAAGSGSSSPLLSGPADDLIKEGETVYITQSQWRLAFPPEKTKAQPGPPETEAQPDVLDLSQPATSVEMYGYLLESKQAHTHRVPRITAEGEFPGTRKGWMRVDKIPAEPGTENCIEVAEDCVWQLSSHGWLNVFARLGQGGPWDLAASYAML